MATLRGALVHRSLWLSLLATMAILLMTMVDVQIPAEVRPLRGIEQDQTEQSAVVPAVDVQPGQPEPDAGTEAIAPVVRSVVVQAQWSEPRLSDPFNVAHTETLSLDKGDERLALALKLVPELEEIGNDVAIWLPIATDRAHPEVTLAALSVVDVRQKVPVSWGRIFLSVDGGKSWYPIALAEPRDNIPAAAVSKIGETIQISVREGTVREMWRDTTLSIEDLP